MLHIEATGADVATIAKLCAKRSQHMRMFLCLQNAEALTKLRYGWGVFRSWLSFMGKIFLKECSEFNMSVVLFVKLQKVS